MHAVVDCLFFQDFYIELECTMITSIVLAVFMKYLASDCSSLEVLESIFYFIFFLPASKIIFSQYSMSVIVVISYKNCEKG